MVFTTGQLLGMTFMGVCVLGIGVALAWLDYAQHRPGLIEAETPAPAALTESSSPPTKPPARRKGAKRSTRKHGR